MYIWIPCNILLKMQNDERTEICPPAPFPPCHRYTKHSFSYLKVNKEPSVYLMRIMKLRFSSHSTKELNPQGDYL